MSARGADGDRAETAILTTSKTNDVRIIESFVWLLPGSRLKNRLLRMFGHDIASSAHIGPILAHNLGHVVMGEGATIDPLNIFRNLRLVQLGDGAEIGKLNTISAFPGFQALDP